MHHCVTWVHVTMRLPQKCMHGCNGHCFGTFIQPQNGGHDPTFIVCHVRLVITPSSLSL